MKLNLKRFLSGVLSVTILTSAIPSGAVFAENDSDCYPYTLFAASSNEGAITVNTSNFCVNGNIATNGTIFSSGNMNVNGTVQENANEEMIYILKKLNYSYFNGDNVDRYTSDYSYEDMNINVNNPMTVDGNLALTGNINLNSGIKAVDDVNINGEVKNTNQAIICSETGDIIINTSNVNFNGLIYAPYGDIIIDTNNLNLNNVVIIGQTITIDCPNINANYSSSVAELVGTESELVVNLYAYGEYNSENNSIDIEWETNYTNSNYEVWYSDDNINYTSIAITDETAYQYQIAEDFESRYFKVSLTTNYGETIESIPFVVRRTEDGYEASYFDSDEDGLPDIYEIELGTDINKVDTDEDGITDYQELFILGSDPLKFDSVTEGVSDADADSDEDGLSNLQEIELGTDPRNVDTDEDGLSDFDEINLYETDSLNPDTDEDGVEDGDELLLYLDPKNPQTYGYPDLEYTSVQEITSDSAIFSAINTEDSPYQMSLSMKTNGYAESNLKVNVSRYSVAIENDAMLGVSADISICDVCNPEDIVVKYSINQDYIANTLNKYSDCDEFKGIKRLNIFKFDDELNMLLPIETKFDVENNSLYAEVDELGTYCIMDMEIWLDNLGVMSSTSDETNNNSGLRYAPKKLAKKSDSEWTPTYTNSPIDLVFLLQKAGQNPDIFNSQKQLIEQFTSHIFEKYNDVNVYLYAFDFDSTQLITINSNSKALTSTNAVSSALNSVTYKTINSINYDNSNRYRKVKSDAVIRNNSDSFIYMFHNAGILEARYTDSYDTIAFCKDEGIYSEIMDKGWGYISNLSYHQQVKTAVEQDKGLFLNDGIDYVNRLIKHIDANISSYNLVYETMIATSWRKIQLEAELSPNNNVDTDKDGLTDWAEVNTKLLKWNNDGSFELPTFFELYTTVDAIDAFQRWKGTEYELPIYQLHQKKVLPVISNPCSQDSDEDGIYDDDEIRPIDDISSDFYSNPFSNDSDDDGLNDFSDPQPMKEDYWMDWNSTWSEINAEDYMARRNINEMIFKCIHPISIPVVLPYSPFYHSLIIIFSNSKSEFYTEPAYMSEDKSFTVQSASKYSSNWENIHYVTIAAGEVEGKLVAEFNRPKDIILSNKTQLLSLTVTSDVNLSIPTLIEKHNYYIQETKKNEIEYAPLNIKGEKKNCHSYISGLLRASNIDDLGYSIGFTEFNLPGYAYPVDMKYFGVTE